MSPSIQVSHLWVYPVKSCGGVSVPELIVDAHGTRDDRRWMIVDSQGKFVTQREIPALALLQTRFDQGQWWLSAPRQNPLNLSDQPYSEIRTVQVWSDTIQADDAGDEASAWLTSAFGRELRLVRTGDQSERRLNEKYRAPEIRFGFADAMPFLLISKASLDDVNSRLPMPIDFRRFRPNLVVDGAPAFDEDHWKELRIGEVRFQVSKGCARCVIINVDPDQGAPSEIKPLQALASYRKKDRGVYFGQYLIQKNAGVIRAGDPVEIISR